MTFSEPCQPVPSPELVVVGNMYKGATVARDFISTLNCDQLASRLEGSIRVTVKQLPTSSLLPSAVYYYTAPPNLLHCNPMENFDQAAKSTPPHETPKMPKTRSQAAKEAAEDQQKVIISHASINNTCINVDIYVADSGVLYHRDYSYILSSSKP